VGERNQGNVHKGSEHAFHSREGTLQVRVKSKRDELDHQTKPKRDQTKRRHYSTAQAQRICGYHQEVDGFPRRGAILEA